jgi:hypothetical protein
MVFVDHAVHLGVTFIAHPHDDTTAPPPPPPPTPSIPSGGGPIGIESDPNFSKLSSRDRELHLWAMSQTRNQTALQSNVGISQECTAEADAIAKGHSHPLGDKPLVDVSTDEFRSPDYDKLQLNLLSLSQNSKQLIAQKSGHFVIINRPDVVIEAINQVVHSIRNNAKL